MRRRVVALISDVTENDFFTVLTDDGLAWEWRGGVWHLCNAGGYPDEPIPVMPIPVPERWREHGG